MQEAAAISWRKVLQVPTSDRPSTAACQLPRSDGHEGYMPARISTWLPSHQLRDVSHCEGRRAAVRKPMESSARSERWQKELGMWTCGSRRGERKRQKVSSNRASSKERCRWAGEGWLTEACCR